MLEFKKNVITLISNKKFQPLKKLARAAAAPLSSSPHHSPHLNTTKLLSFPSISHLSFPHQSFHSHLHTTSPTKIIICNSKLDGPIGDEDEEIGDILFDDNEMVDYESDDEDETESSVDLFIIFLQSMFKKLSKRAKKASRSMLPSVISPQLVSFAVDGILLLAVLSILKALLEVVCAIGGTVFAVILLLRVAWAAIAYFQSSGNTFNSGGGGSYGTTQPVT